MKYGFGTNIQYDRWLRMTIPQCITNYQSMSSRNSMERCRRLDMAGQDTHDGHTAMQNQATPTDAEKQAAFQEINDL